MTPAQQGSTALLRKALNEIWLGLDKLARQLALAKDEAGASALREAMGNVSCAESTLSFALEAERRPYVGDLL